MPRSARHNDAADGRLRLVSTADRGLPSELAGAIDGHLASFAEHVREGLLAASTAVGLEVMAEMMEAEVVNLAGPKGRHDAGRTHTRHGTEHGSVTLGGRRLQVARPRVRTVGDEPAEATLASYAMFASADLLTEQVTARMLAGISTRKYPVALEPVGEAVERSATSTSKSAVSRRFVTATAERLAELCARPLDEHRWPIVMLDGVHVGEHLLVVALGVTDDGTKVPLGVVEGSTENAAVCGQLVADLVDRGLDASKGVLFVIDGGKALAKAIRAAFGPKALIQRCRRHKERNVLGHLPEAERPLIQRKLRAAWANPDADTAERELTALARALDKKRPGAAASLREGMADTLTVNRLGITGSLVKTVESTNPVESMIEIVRHHARRVKRWQHGEMALRWTAAGMLAAEEQFRRVKGFRELPQLLASLEAMTADQPGADTLEQRVAG
ncbi:MAG: IS256 family transposase [Roseovarius sp.]|jgi:transposase-like protein|nr:IS256 family transposase [Roseovarius sp.]